MDRNLDESEARFSAYVEALSGALGHANRAGPLKDYCTGLLLPGERKSVEPMAAVVAPERVAAEHQSLLHLVGQGAWSDEAVLRKVRDLVLPALERQAPIEAWIVDDTGFPKKGVHSVGVARQYCGRLGKQDNCQVAVSLSVAHHQASLPIAYRLYLPEEWAGDAARRAKAKVPAAVAFQTKPEIALDQIAAARATGVPPGVVLADAAYGCNGAFRAGVSALDLAYAVGIQSNATVWPPGLEPLPATTSSGRGRPASRLRRDANHAPVSVKTLALSLPAESWILCTWREGSNAPLSSRFCSLRVRSASRDWKRTTPHPVEWLLIEWPEGEPEPSKYWLSTLPAETDLATLVDTAKLRWRIERDYEELKSELGLAHYEGRGWRGFHHHATLCIAAYGFLIRERAAFPPSGPLLGQAPRLPGRPRPRGAADSARTTRRVIHRDTQEKARRGSRQNPQALSMLPNHDHTTI
jgi:SRSO17 transposase